MDRANRIEIFKSMMQCLNDPEIPEKLEEWGFFDAPAKKKKAVASPEVEPEDAPEQG